MEFNYVKKYYNVPACLGRIVKVDGKSGVIVKDCGHYIGVNFDDDKPGFISNCHPTWNVEYLGIGSIRKSPNPTAYLDFNVWVDCPDCNASLNITDEDDGNFTEKLFGGRWDELQDYDVYCDNCEYEFQIEKVEY